MINLFQILSVQILAAQISYDQLAHVIKLGGTVVFTAVFVLAIAYALWPRNREKFDRAAHMPLNDSDEPDL